MTQPTGLGAAWQKAFLARDLDAICALYEDDAVFVMPSMEIAAEGRTSIRDAWARLLDMVEADSVEIIERDEHLVTDDMAYAHQHGMIHGRIGGTAADVPIRTTEVMRRGADGMWRYVLDHA